MAVLTQVVVAPRSAVAADDVDLTVGVPEANHQIMQKVEFPDVVILHVAGAVIAKKVIELRDGIGQIVISNAIDDIDSFSRVKVIKAQPVLFGACGRG